MDADTSNRVVSSQWVRNQGYVTALSGDVTYNGVGPFTTQQTFNLGIKTNNIVALDVYSTLSLPETTAQRPNDADSSTRVVTSQWVRNQNYLTASSLPSDIATYAGTSPFTTQQTFNAGIKTNAVSLVSGTTLTLPASTTTTPAVPDNTTLVPTTSWVNTTITNAINAITGFVTYAGTTAFTALQTFSAGLKTTKVDIIDEYTALTIGGGARQSDINIGEPTTFQAGGVKIGRNCNGGIRIGDLFCPTFNLGASNSQFTVKAFRKIETLTCFGTEQSTVNNIIGSTENDSCINRCVSRIAVASSATQSVFNINTSVKFTPPSTFTDIIVAQMFELYIQGRNSGSNIVYSQKVSFIVSNTSGAVGVMGGTFTTDKNYSSGAASVSVGFTQPSMTRLVITVSTPTVGSTGQYYYATLISYPAMNSEGNFQFSIYTGASP